MHMLAETAASLHELSRVVTLSAANDDDDVAVLSHLDSRDLPVLGRLANGVNETHFGIGKCFANQTRQIVHFFKRLGRLRGDSESWTWSETQHIVFVQQIGRASCRERV